jgi:GTP cyclohydrolase II
MSASLKKPASPRQAQDEAVAKKARVEPSNGDSKSEDYSWKEVHEDLERGHFAGVYSGPNAVYFGLAGLRAGVDMDSFHTKRTKDEYHVESLDRLLKNPRTQRRWKDICTLDPLGMYAKRPTIAATTARMDIPELHGQLEVDNTIVNPDQTINCVKCAVDYVWNIPKLTARLKFSEDDVRRELYRFTLHEKLKDKSYRAYLPPTGGLTVYFFGDIDKLADPKTEVAVRVHDQCTGSDVFGTDICTCRPYLVFALKGCVECAQRGGVGLVIYFQKEGRSLGEVTKFRVYNARKMQEGGDKPEKYFYQTESIAGIRDARFQEMMPDALLWLGIERIDILLSMSSDKYDAIRSLGIDVQQRVSLPDKFVPKGAVVELTAKISAGYHSETMEAGAVVQELRELRTVRERCYRVFELAKQGKTRHFSLHLDKMGEVVKLVLEVTKQNYPDLAIPYHSRWRHFNQRALDALTNSWRCDHVERARRMLDLATVSVLLDAGSGPSWKYTDKNQNVSYRSEGIALATFDMFSDGLFSSDRALPHRVNSLGLQQLSETDFQHGLQISSANPMVGIKGRFKLLQRLAACLNDKPEFFGAELPRPGNMVDYVLASVRDGKVSLRVLWRALIEGLEGVWPENMSGIRRGDIWHYPPLKQAGQVASDLIPFHKLSQWLLYSLLEPIEALGIQFTDMDLATGLAEYRNGGLFVDAGVLQLVRQNDGMTLFDVGSELVVEWRALTVCLLDETAKHVRAALKLDEKQLPLAKVLQGGTWAAGRVIAKRLRPETGGPPINIRSDGSVF